MLVNPQPQQTPQICLDPFAPSGQRGGKLPWFMHAAATHTLFLVCFSYKKRKKKKPLWSVKALAEETGHAATAWGDFNGLGGAQRPRRNLDIKLIHLKSDSPLRAKAVENANKHTLKHTQVYRTDSLSNQHLSGAALQRLYTCNDSLARSCRCPHALVTEEEGWCACPDVCM